MNKSKASKIFALLLITALVLPIGVPLIMATMQAGNQLENQIAISMLTSFNIQTGISARASDIIVDTEKGESGFLTYPARELPYYWVRVPDHDTFRTRAYNGNFWYTLCGEEGQGELYYGVWMASLPQSGVYEVFVWIPNPDPFEYDGRVYTPTQSAIYQVYHKDGATNIIVNQRLRTGGFYSLGKFNFDTTASVILNDRTGEPYCSTMIAFDAIRFVLNQLPTAIIDSMTPNPAEQGKDIVSFAGHGTDSDGSIVAYNWRSSIDGQLSTLASFTKPASQLSVGMHTIYFRVQDNDGSWSTETPAYLTINPAPNQPPVLSYFPTFHNFGDKYEGTTDSTTFDVWNSGGGTLTYSLSESSGWVTVHPTSGSSTVEYDTIGVDIDTTGLSQGSHSCYIFISSNGGSATFTVTVNVINPPDTTPETVITSGPSGTIDYNDVTFTWTGSDDVTPTSALVYSYYLEGYDIGWSGWTLGTSKSYYDLPNGDYTFRVKAKDQAGNVDPTPAINSFTVSVNLPDLDITSESLRFQDNIPPPFLPNVVNICARVVNTGTLKAENVVVKVFLGDPDHGGVQIGTSEGEPVAIEPREGRFIDVICEFPSSVENGIVYARAFPIGQEDANFSDNTINQSFSFYFVDFRHDRDAFKFKNWGYSSWDELRNEMGWYLAQVLEKDIANVVTYPLIRALTELGFLMKSSGYCYGMATSSVSYYLWPEVKPIDKPTFRMEKEEVKEDIIECHWKQILHIWSLIKNIIEGETEYNAGAEYNKILKEIRDHYSPVVIVLDSMEGKHAVVAYKVVDVSNNEKLVYVYENNLPYDDPTDGFYPGRSKDRDYYIIFKPLSNEVSYTLQGANKTYEFNRAYAIGPLQIIGLEEIRTSLQELLSSWFNNLWNKARMLFSVHSPVICLITDEFGRRIGYVDGIFVNEIPGAQMEQQLDSKIFYLPLDLTYTVDMTGTETGVAGLDIIVSTGESRARVAVFEDLPFNLNSKVNTTLNATDVTYEVMLDTGEIINPKYVGEIDASDIIPPAQQLGNEWMLILLILLSLYSTGKPMLHLTLIGVGLAAAIVGIAIYLIKHRRVSLGSSKVSWGPRRWEAT